MALIDQNKVIDEIQARNYQKSALNPQSWFSDGERNKYIASLLYKKYNSYYRKLILHYEENPFDISGRNKPIRRRGLNDYDGDLHKYILMFFGVAIECYLKAYLIKYKKLKPLHKNSIKLSKEINHGIVNYYRNAFPEATSNEISTLNALEKAIKDGKYHIAGKVNYSFSFVTYDLDKKIKIANKIINKVRKSF